MKKAKGQLGNKISKGILLGITVALTISIGTAALLSTLVIHEAVGEKAVATLVPIIQFIASAVCGLTAGKIAGEKYAVITSGAVGGYCLILTMFTILVFDSTFVKAGLSILMCAAGLVISCFLCMMKKHKRKFK